jgi:hypothetical protein
MVCIDELTMKTLRETILGILVCSVLALLVLRAMTNIERSWQRMRQRGQINTVLLGMRPKNLLSSALGPESFQVIAG